MAGIKDVATLAGVSVATVSRTINEPDKVTEQTRITVQKAIKKLNYHPNVLARDFRTRRTSRIIVLVPDISNTFFSNVIRGIQRQAKGLKYAVLLGETRNDKGIEREYASMVLSRQADGIIQFSPSNPFLDLAKDNDPLTDFWVNACECISDTTTPKIRIDNTKAMETIANQVLEMGHKKISVLLGPADSPLTISRLSGVYAALEKKKIDPKSLTKIEGDFSARSGTQAALDLLKIKTKPTAVLCFNDEMAFGLIHGLKQSGLSIPEDMSVTGFDDIELAQYCDPPLSTISQPAMQIGSTAMTALHKKINGKFNSDLEHILPADLIVRSSIAAPRQRQIS
ncbi:LacI family DNA-binding transcriptional regulator [Hirschia litorea]|uniref:LacI family DNA-binding transcriptional regulator n=1 Tax=Hirschia litorea TaxID=1199156 RepID=A0ABW2IN79_9PROT